MMGLGTANQRPTLTSECKVLFMSVFSVQSKVILRGALDSAKNHKRQRRKRQSVTAKREKSQTPKFV